MSQKVNPLSEEGVGEAGTVPGGDVQTAKKKVTLNGLIIQRSAKYICIPIYLYTHIIHTHIYIYMFM